MDDPVKYSKYNKSSVKDAEHFLSKYKNFLKWTGSEDILEIGCAIGTVTKDVLYPFVEEHVDKLLGADISQEAVDIANQMNSTHKVSFCRMDIEEDCLGEKYKEQFSHIFTFSVLHMFETSDVWSRNLHQMLKPKGQLFATVVILPHPYATVVMAQRADKSAPWAKYLGQGPDLYTDYGPNPPQKFGDILIRASFSVDVAKVETLTSRFESFEHFSGTLLASNPFLKHIPEELRDAYTQDLLQRLLECVDREEDYLVEELSCSNGYKKLRRKKRY